jgi:hypothetical protein
MEGNVENPIIEKWKQFVVEKKGDGSKTPVQFLADYYDLNENDLKSAVSRVSSGRSPNIGLVFLGIVLAENYSANGK